MPRKNTSIPVYASEKSDGLSTKIQSNASIAYVTQIEDLQISQKVARELLLSVGSYDEEQFDLFYLNTILVTTGWNKNADIFDKVDVWGARYSPIHKQFNLEHDQSRIIGHMTSAKAVDEKYELISDSVSVDELPDKFHILTGAVIYKALADEKAQEEIDKIIEEIGKGEWYVSMECLFRNFDYGITSATGEQKVLPRNESTAWLTKHLRQYGGSGEYNGFTLGRVLRNITFSGKGLVRNPANPESIIFDKVVANFNATYVDLGYIKSSEGSEQNKGNIDMADTNTNQASEAEIRLLKEQLDKLTLANTELNGKVKEFESSATNHKIANLEADVTARDNRIKDLETQLASLRQEKADVDGKLASASTKSTELEKELNQMKNEKRVEARVSKLVKANAPEDEARTLVSLFNEKNDEEFDSIVKLFGDKWKAPAPAVASAPTPTPTPTPTPAVAPVAEKPTNVQLQVEPNTDQAALAGVSNTDNEGELQNKLSNLCYAALSITSEE